MKYTLLLLPPVTAEARIFGDRLQIDIPGISVTTPGDSCQLIQALQTADAAYGKLGPELIRFASRLRWLQAPQAAPPPGFFSPELVKHPVVVTNMRATYTNQVSSHAVGLVLALARALPTYSAQQHRRQWRQHLHPSDYVDLSAATTLIVGLGAVGTEVARLLKAFGGRILATDARTTASPKWVDELRAADALNQLLPKADVVVLTLPHTPATENLFTATRFALMKPGARFVNVGRGPVVHLDDLLAALKSGRLAGAALDVFAVEPLPASHPLWDLEQVILTPHVAIAPDTPDLRYEILLDNARRFGAGEPLRNLVDKAAWF